MKKLNPKHIGLLLVMLHLVGVVGYLSENLQPIFFILTPFNLLLTACVTFLLHPQKTASIYVASIVVALAGYFVEVLGTSTGFPFGEYSYQTTLGFQLWKVPLVLAANWFILVYCCTELAQRISNNKFIIPLLAASFMVLLDFLIEPVAIKYQYWHWQSDSVPTSNYVSWFIISLVLSYYLFSSVKKYRNPVAPFVLIAQLLYFLLLNIL